MSGFLMIWRISYPAISLNAGMKRTRVGGSDSFCLRHPEFSGIHSCPQVCRGLEGTADLVPEGQERVVMPDNHEVAGK